MLGTRRTRCKRRRVLRRAVLGARARVSRSGVRQVQFWRIGELMLDCSEQPVVLWTAGEAGRDYGGRRLKGHA